MDTGVLHTCILCASALVPYIVRKRSSLRAFLHKHLRFLYIARCHFIVYVVVRKTPVTRLHDGCTVMIVFMFHVV